MEPIVIRAKTAGFCLGVALALKKLDKVISEKKHTRIYTLGPIIHNPQVLEHYRQKGVEPLDNLSIVSKASCVVIRAHGIPKDIEIDLKNKGLEVIDATCPKVKKAQMLIEKESLKGKKLLLFGEKTHPEVKGLLSYAMNDSIVFENKYEFANLVSNHKIKGKSYFLAAQTTQDRKEYNEIVDYAIRNIDANIVALDTICDTTRERQKEAVKIAKQVDLVIVVGGYNSGNTRRLVKVVRETGCRCIHIEVASEIKKEYLKDCSRVGLTAGASTPRHIIDEVEEKIKNILTKQEGE